MGTGDAASSAKLLEEIKSSPVLLSEMRVRALRLTGNAADADDLVQAVLERALVRRYQVDLVSSPRAWLMRVMHNVFLDSWRLRQRRETEKIGPEIEESLAAPETSPPDAWASVSPEQLSAAMALLPSPMREVFRLRVVDGLNYQEISLRLQIPRATVGTRLARARHRLRDLLMLHMSERAGTDES